MICSLEELSYDIKLWFLSLFGMSVFGISIWLLPHKLPYKLHGDHYFIGDLGEHVCFARKILQNVLFYKSCSMNITISLEKS